MSIITSGIASNSIAAATSRNSAQVPDVGKSPAKNPVLAATVEISSGARQAYAAGLESTGKQGLHPLNIIWGNSPK